MCVGVLLFDACVVVRGYNRDTRMRKLESNWNDSLINIDAYALMCVGGSKGAIR